MGSNVAERYKIRAYALRCFLLPMAIANFDEVIVAGEWEEGEGYTYVHAPSKFFGAEDALHQRQAGFEASTGDVIVHCHDDHYIEGNTHGRPFDVLSPARYTRLRRVAGERINGGEPAVAMDGVVAASGGYILGHGAIYRRAVLETAPWKNVPAIFTWDIQHTAQIKSLGLSIEWVSTIKAWDVEYGSRPWK